jgi:hypothetical protein
VWSNSPARLQVGPLSYPPLPKNLTKIPLQNEADTPSPSRSSHSPRVRSLIVVSLRLATRGCGLIRPPGRKLQPLSYPPPSKKFEQNPLTKRRCHAIPRPFQPPPPPPRTLVDCGVVEVGKRAVWSNSPAWLQIATSILPPPHRKIRPKSPSKNDVATPSPAVPAPTPAYAR